MEKGKYNILNFKLYYIIQGVYIMLNKKNKGITLVALVITIVLNCCGAAMV